MIAVLQKSVKIVKQTSHKNYKKLSKENNSQFTPLSEVDYNFSFHSISKLD